MALRPPIEIKGYFGNTLQYLAACVKLTHGNASSFQHLFITFLTVVWEQFFLDAALMSLQIAFQ